TIATFGESLDLLARLREYRRGDFQAECVRRLEVDDEVELRGLRARQVSGVSAPEDAIDVGGRVPDRVGVVLVVEQESALLDPGPDARDHRGQAARGKEVDDPLLLTLQPSRTSGDHDRIRVAAAYGNEGIGDARGSAHVV